MKALKENLAREKWLQSLTVKEQGQIEARMERIKSHSHFGDCEPLASGLYELRWKNGWRVYFARKQQTNIIVLLAGGHKNGQEKDIKKARTLLR